MRERIEFTLAAAEPNGHACMSVWLAARGNKAGSMDFGYQIPYC